MARLEIVGGGRMGEALLGGLLEAGWARPDELVVVERLPARRVELAERFPGVGVVERPVPADGAVVAVKPADVVATVHELGEQGVGRILSIAAGVSIGTIESALPGTVPVVRAMPNTPSLIGMGASAYAGGTAAGDDDLDWADSILRAVGVAVRVGEGQLDAVTGLSGSGPAYLFLVAEALADAGVREGLPRPVAEALAGQTVYGAGALLAEGTPAAELRAAVTSPGGTTAAGLHALEAAAVRAAVADAVRAATERSRELG